MRRTSSSWRASSSWGGWSRTAGERRGAEVHTESPAPDGHGTVLREVHVRRELVVLVADVALERTDVDVAGLRHGLVVLRVAGGEQQHLDVRTVRGVEAGQSQDAAAVGVLVDRSRAAGL